MNVSASIVAMRVGYIAVIPKRCKKKLACPLKLTLIVKTRTLFLGGAGPTTARPQGERAWPEPEPCNKFTGQACK